MPDEKEVQDIKAGVDGVLSDVPAPSGDEAAPPTTTEVPAEEQAPPATEYGGYDTSTVDYGQPAPQYDAGPQQLDMERIHEIIEAIVGEKWQESMAGLGDLVAWKEKINHDVVSIKQELIRLEERFEQLQNAVLGRVKTYDEGIKGVHTEMKALEQVFSKILEPLTTNIKELNRITQDLKGLKK